MLNRKAIRPFTEPETLSKIVPIYGPVETVLGELSSKHAFSQPTIRWLDMVLRSGVSDPLPPIDGTALDLCLPGLRKNHAVHSSVCQLSSVRP